MQALQKEVVLLESELAQQESVSAPVPATFDQTTLNNTLGAPIVGEVPASGDQAPTSTTDGSPIVYVNQNTDIQSCSLNANVQPSQQDGQNNLSSLTTIDWELSGIPTSTWGTVTPVDTSKGNFTYQLAPNNEKLESTFWIYFPGGIVAKFGSTTCTTYLPDEAYTYIPSSTIYSTQ